jgi:hypothetical protein
MAGQELTSSVFRFRPPSAARVPPARGRLPTGAAKGRRRGGARTRRAREWVTMSATVENLAVLLPALRERVDRARGRL